MHFHFLLAICTMLVLPLFESLFRVITHDVAVMAAFYSIWWMIVDFFLDPHAPFFCAILRSTIRHSYISRLCLGLFRVCVVLTSVWRVRPAKKATCLLVTTTAKRDARVLASFISQKASTISKPYNLSSSVIMVYSLRITAAASSARTRRSRNSSHKFESVGNSLKTHFQLQAF